MGCCEEVFSCTFLYQRQSSSFPFLLCLLFTCLHFTTFILCELFCCTPAGLSLTFSTLWISSSMDLGHGLQAHFPFLFVSHMGCFYIFLSLSPTNTDINTHTHSRICTLTRFFIYRKKDRLVLGLLRFHYFCHASPLSRVLHWQLGNTCKYTISPS